MYVYIYCSVECCTFPWQYVGSLVGRSSRREGRTTGREVGRQTGRQAGSVCSTRTGRTPRACTVGICIAYVLCIYSSYLPTYLPTYLLGYICILLHLLYLAEIEIEIEPESKSNPVGPRLPSGDWGGGEMGDGRWEAGDGRRGRRNEPQRYSIVDRRE